MPIMDPTLIRLAVIVSAVTGTDIRRIRHASSWNDVGADSLSRAEIFAACEREFNCELSDSACEDLNTVGDLAALVDKAKARAA